MAHLLNMGVNLSAKDAHQLTALHYAALQLRIGIMTMFLERGAHPHTKVGIRNKTPLSIILSMLNDSDCKYSREAIDDGASLIVSYMEPRG